MPLELSEGVQNVAFGVDIKVVMSNHLYLWQGSLRHSHSKGNKLEMRAAS